MSRYKVWVAIEDLQAEEDVDEYALFESDSLEECAQFVHSLQGIDFYPVQEYELERMID